MKLENVSSPAKLCESEESGVGENRSKEKGMNNCEAEERSVNGIQNVGSSVLIAKKNKILIKEDIGDGVRRQGRSGRGLAFSRASIAPKRKKFENPTTMKPLRSARPGSDKNGRCCVLSSDSGNKFMFLTFIIYHYYHTYITVYLLGSASRPSLKRQSNRKTLTRLGQTPNSSSPDFTGAFKAYQKIRISCVCGVHFNNFSDILNVECQLQYSLGLVAG